MSQRHLARAHADVVRRLRRDLLALSPLLLMAIALAWAMFHEEWMLGQPGRTRDVRAEVVEVSPASGDGVVVDLVYLDPAGDPRSLQREYAERPDLAPGDLVEIRYVAGVAESARPLTDGDRLFSRLMGGLLAFVLLALAVIGGFALRRYTRRRHLLRHGRHEAGQGGRIETTQFTFKNATQPMWRLHLKRFEPARAEWIDCRSDWQAGLAPVLAADTELPPVLVDPRDPARHWLPVGVLGDDAPKPG